jgi:hypothetical protein
MPMSSLFNYLSSFFKGGAAKSGEEIVREGGMLAVRLLQNDEVRAELKLTAEQSSQILALVRATRQKHRPRQGARREVDEGEGGNAQRQERMKRMATVTAEILEGLEKSHVLTPEQQGRLRQITWQNRGAAAFADPALQEALALSENQKEAIRGVIEEVRRKAARQGGGGGRGGGGRGGGGEGGGGNRDMGKLLASRRDAQARAVALLNPEQQQRWQELRGQPFEVHFEDKSGPGGAED